MYSFSISDEQIKKLDEWMAKKEKVYCGAIGGRYSYCFTPTSLGTVVVVKDAVKKDEIDLSDYMDW